MKRRVKSLWATFLMHIMAVFLGTTVLMSCFAVLAFRGGRLHGDRPILPVLFLLVFSVLISTALSSVVGKRILTHVTQMTQAARQVAKGDFTVRLPEVEAIPEVQEMSQNFNAMVQALSSIETLQNDFVVNVSHEFKTPLAAIEGYATLLQDERLTAEERQEYTGMIIDSSRQLSGLVGSILKLSKLENQEIMLTRSVFRLDEQLRQAILQLEPKWSVRQLELELNLVKASCRGNPDLLNQVWLNLLDNAIKFTPPGGLIGVDMEIEPEQITVTIRDTGRGIPADQLEHIFDKFYQADSTRKEEGNGLGLALVRRILQLCGADITVKSHPNQGSTFTVTLPTDL